MTPDSHGRFDAGRLGRDLAEIFDARIAVPAEIDRVVVADAHRRLVAASPRRLPVAVAAAVAAGLALAAGVTWLAVSPPSRLQPAAAKIDPIDLDWNGRIDILDAFALARRLESSDVPAGADLTGDGVVDRADVEAIAVRAVALPTGAG